jgi:uncharacterized iron-regulated membrane protein
MIRKRSSWMAATRTSAAVGAALLLLGLAACGGSGSGSTAAQVTKTVTQGTSASTASGSAGAPATTSSTQAAAPEPAPDNSNRAADNGGAIPDYKPSSVVSKSPYSTALTSPDSIAQVGAFYASVLEKDGWQISAKATSNYSASFTAQRTGEGVTISVYPRGSGSGISVSRPPQ